MPYASNTSVPEDRSRNEIEKLTAKYKATNFAYANGQREAMVGFEIGNRRVRFVIHYPPKIFRPTGYRRHTTRKFDENAAMEQERRRLWRALVLVVKAKLEAVDSKVETFDQAFMAHIVMPNGETIAQHLGDQIAQMLQSGGRGQLILTAEAGPDASGQS